MELASLAQRRPCWCAGLALIHIGPAALQWAPSRGLQHALCRLDRGESAQGRAAALALGCCLIWLCWGREHVARLRSAARLVVVALPRRQLLLHQLRHHQRRIDMLVLDDRRLVHLPDLVEHPAGEGVFPMPDFKPAIGILADVHPLACQWSADLAGIEDEQRLV